MNNDVDDKNMIKAVKPDTGSDEVRIPEGICLAGQYYSDSSDKCEDADIRRCQLAGGKDLCLNCEDGYYFNNETNDCEEAIEFNLVCGGNSCDVGEYFNTRVNRCRDCMDNCDRCSNGYECLECANGYEYDEDNQECVEIQVGGGDQCLGCLDCEDGCNVCNPFTIYDSDSKTCHCQFLYSKAISRQVNVGENQILIETYNLKWDFENLNIDEDDNTVDCTSIFDYSKDSSIMSRKSVQRDLDDLVCTIEDLSSEIEYTDAKGKDRTVEDLKTRITVTLCSNRILELFESGDLKFELD